MSDGVIVKQLAAFRPDSTLGILLVLVLVAGASFALSLGAQFLNLGTFEAMAFQLPELGLLALAMMLPMLCGGINLSVVATANFTSLTIATLFSAISSQGGSVGAPWIVASLFFGLLLSATIGLLSGFIVAYLGVSPILTTLGMMTLIKGVDIGLTHGGVLSGFPPALLFLGNGKLFGIPVAMYIFLACASVLALLLNRTAFGLTIYMVGSSEPAMRFSGVDTRRVLLKVYALSGLLCGVAAVVMMARFNSANASYGESYLLVTILAAVLGGIDPFGGFGRVSGLLAALVILQITASGFNLLGFSSHLTLAIWGLILIAAVVLNLVKTAGGSQTGR